MTDREWFIRAMEDVHFHNLQEALSVDVLARYEQVQLEEEQLTERDRARHEAIEEMSLRVHHWEQQQVNADATSQGGQRQVNEPERPASVPVVG